MRTVSKIALGSLMLVLGGCGGSSGVAKIKGAWKSTTYSQTFNCPGLGTAQNTVPTIAIWSGVDADLVQTQSNSACVLNADVAGFTASAIAGQSCLVNDTLDAITINITLSAYTFSLGADYQTATESGSGSALVTSTTDGTSTTCTYTLQATYTKIGT